ncbi:MAG TPA: oxygenase MpaB family protein [Acidimicrobiales bacterium]|nr:oxygenase MpaB family protein [Acidimicrobiales bacterium]
MPSSAPTLTDLALAPLRLPLRLLGTLTEPARGDLRRQVRRSLGVPPEPVAPVSDPGEAFLPPGSVARRVHGDLPSMVIGGLSALLLQSLHPLAMAGVADHSNYREDAVGRLRRTASFVGYTTFGTVDQAERAIEQVRQVHRRVHGVAPDGRPYSADDPDLVTWIHVAEITSFLASCQRFGPRPLSAVERDAYWAGTATVARALGAEWVPETADQATTYLGRVRPILYAGPQARAARDFLLRGVARRPNDRAAYAVIVAAAVTLLPGWARAELGLPMPPLVDPLLVTPVARLFCGGLRWAVAPPT